MKRTFATLAAVGFAVLTISAQEALPDKYEQPLGTCYEELVYPYPTAYLNLLVEGQNLRMSFNGRTTD